MWHDDDARETLHALGLCMLREEGRKLDGSEWTAEDERKERRAYEQKHFGFLRETLEPLCSKLEALIEEQPQGEVYHEQFLLYAIDTYLSRTYR